MTVVVSSDTDIYISPGLYGDCLPTSATGKATESFRAGRVLFLFFSRLVHLMLAHGWESGQRPVDGGRRGAGGAHSDRRWAPTGFRPGAGRVQAGFRPVGTARVQADVDSPDAGIHVTWTL
ncbi:hypothetical protein TNCT6_45410 [Streptomyces sp. 6-11-2]|nr:hypothetical protein TNCT6_45410 [Streptomyces sp. 6-11-2]